MHLSINLGDYMKMDPIPHSHVSRVKEKLKSKRRGNTSIFMFYLYVGPQSIHSHVQPTTHASSFLAPIFTTNLA